MSAKMTSGPWHVGVKQAHRIIYDATGWAVADVTVYHGKESQDEMLANAQAIACVPDLIAALQDLINPRFDQAYRDGEYWAVQAQTAARAALAKAGVA